MTALDLGDAEVDLVVLGVVYLKGCRQGSEFVEDGFVGSIATFVGEPGSLGEKVICFCQGSFV